MLQITGLRLIGGLLLLYIVYKLYIDVIKGSENEEDIKVDNSSFLKAIWTVLLADFTMSLDNVLGVADGACQRIITCCKNYFIKLQFFIIMRNPRELYPFLVIV